MGIRPPQPLPRGTVPQGWALTRQEQWVTGMAKLREGREAALAAGSELWNPYFLALLAGAEGEVKASGVSPRTRHPLSGGQKPCGKAMRLFYLY